MYFAVSPKQSQINMAAIS